jgi:hypothetical protein
MNCLALTSKSAFIDPTAKSAFIRIGNLLLSSEIQGLSCSLKHALIAPTA